MVQAGSVLFDTPATLDKLEALAARAAAGGAQLAVFPEAFIGGYPKGLDFGAVVGYRSPEGRQEFRRYWESAIDLDGPETARIGRAARQHSLHMVTGIIERDHGTLYCTVLFHAPSGELLAKHRKVMPTAMERLIWGYGDGSTLSVLQTPIGNIGAVICWENYMPMLRMAMYAKHVQIYCAPTVDDRETWPITMRHIALEGRCFVLSAVQHTDRIRGGSVIVSPTGSLLAGPAYNEETVLFADLNFDSLAEGKFDFDAVGHYARPDLFQLRVNEVAQRPVLPAE